MSKQSKTILITAAILLAIGGLIYFTGGSQGPLDGGQNNAGQIRPIEAADHTIGDLNAPARMIVYSDFECPYCEQFASTLKEVENNFKEKVVIAFRHYPLPSHREAGPAAQASECAAEQGKFWQMHDKLFAANAAGRMSDEQYKQDAADLGLDTAKFNQCLDSGKYRNKVENQAKEAEKADVSGTPTSFINGRVYPGAYPFEDFTAPDGQRELGLKSIISELLK